MNPIDMNCVNCDKFITDLRESCLVMEQSMKIISLIEQWILPRVLSKTDNLCQACWNLAIEVINIKNEPYDDIQPGNSHDDNDCDPLKVKTESPSPIKEETETSPIMFEKDPLKLEPEESKLNNEGDLEAQLSDEREQEVQLSDLEDASKQKVQQSNSEDEMEQEIQVTNSEDEIEMAAVLSNDDNEVSEYDHINAKRKKLDTHIATGSNFEVKDDPCDTLITKCHDIEQIKDHNYVKKNVIIKGSDEHKAETQRALRRGCSVCGRSILTRRSKLIICENPTENHQLTAKHILAAVTREITVFDRVCHRCYQKYERIRNKMQIENLRSVAHSTSSTYTKETEEHAGITQDETNVVAQSDQNDPSSNSDPDWVPTTKLKVDDNEHSESTSSEPRQQITLMKYKRAPSSSSHCIFFRCKSKTRKTPKEDLRMRVLVDYNYYIPARSRICSFHLISNNWDQLFHSQNSMSTFYSDQIEDIFDLLNKSKSQANFDNIMSVNDNLLEFLIGMNKKKFFDFLKEVPEVNNIHRGICGLVAVLIKHYRHESDENISSVMNLPRPTIARLMTTVKAALSKRGDILEAYVSSKIYSRAPYQKKNNTSAT